MNLICNPIHEHCVMAYRLLSFFLGAMAIIVLGLTTGLRSKSFMPSLEQRREIFGVGYVIAGFFCIMAIFLWNFS